MKQEVSPFGHGGVTGPPVWREAVALARPMPLTGAQIQAWQQFVKLLEPSLDTVARIARGSSSQHFTPEPWARLCAWWALVWNSNFDTFEPLGAGRARFTDRLEAACAPGMTESLSGDLRRAVVRLLLALLAETRVCHLNSSCDAYSATTKSAIISYQQLLARLLPGGQAGADGTTIWLALLGTGRPKFEPHEALSLTSLLDWMLQEAEVSNYWLMRADKELRRQVSGAGIGNEHATWYLGRILAALRARGGRYSAELLADQIDAFYGQYTAFEEVTPAEIGLLLKGLGPRVPDGVLGTLFYCIFHDSDTLVTKRLAVTDDEGLAAMAMLAQAVERVGPESAERYLRVIGRITEEGAEEAARVRDRADAEARAREAAWMALSTPID